MLRLDQNQLAALPKRFGQLVSLLTLWLDQNQLTPLPESFGQLATLRVLWLDQNQLTSLPESIGQLASLQTLRLDPSQGMPGIFEVLRTAMAEQVQDFNARGIASTL